MAQYGNQAKGSAQIMADGMNAGATYMAPTVQPTSHHYVTFDCITNRPKG